MLQAVLVLVWHIFHSQKLYGVTNILFVNMRERNAVEAAYELYRAQYDYVLARGGLLYARGALAKPVADTVLAKYGNPLKAAGKHGYKQPGRD